MSMSILHSKAFKAIIALVVILIILKSSWRSEALTDDELYEFAKETDKVQFCHKIKDLDLRESCYYYIAGRKRDLELCKLIKADIKSQSMCLYELITKKEFSLESCDLIASENLRFDCYINYAVKKKDMKLCEKVDIQSGLVSKDSCYEKFAIINKDPEICNKIVSESISPSRDSCNYLMIIDSSDVSHCFKIVGDEMKYLCVTDMITEYGTQNICMNITDNNIKSNCLDYMENYPPDPARPEEGGEGETER